jgi:hypothetical protein
MWRFLATSIALLFAVAAFFGVYWVSREQVAASRLAAADELLAIQESAAALGEGSAPTDWPTRGFIPSSVLQSAISALSGSQILIPIGKPVNNHVDGYVRVTISSAELMPNDFKIGVRISGNAAYEPDNKNPWWSNANIDTTIDAILLPAAESNDSGVITTEFRLVPDSISTTIGWRFFSLRTFGFAAAVTADAGLLNWGDRLVVPITALAVPIKLDPNLDSSSTQPFGGGGATNVTMKMQRPKFSTKISFDHWLSTSSGIWLLGGQNKTAPYPQISQVDLDKLRSDLAGQLKSFQSADGLVKVAVSGKELTTFLDTILAPPPLTIHIGTEKTSGTILNADVWHNDKILGNFGLRVLPKGEDFGTGTIEITPGHSTWSQDGLSLPVSITADASMT